MIPLHFSVLNPDEVLADYGAGAVIAVQSGAAQAGPFGALTTVAIVTATYSYSYVHAAGTTSTWYRSRYESQDGGTASDWSEPWPGQGQWLLTLDEARARINVHDPDDTSQDAYLPPFLDAVTDQIHDMTGRYFLPDPADGTDGTFYFDGDGSRTLYVPRGIVSITNLYTTTLTGGTYAEITAGNYFIKPEPHQRRPGMSADRIVLSEYGAYWFGEGIQTVKLVGKLGAASVPARIAEIAGVTLVRAWSRRGSGELDATAVMDGARAIVSRSFALDDRLYLESLRPALVG